MPAVGKDRRFGDASGNPANHRIRGQTLIIADYGPRHTSWRRLNTPAKKQSNTSSVPTAQLLAVESLAAASPDLQQAAAGFPGLNPGIQPVQTNSFKQG